MGGLLPEASDELKGLMPATSYRLRSALSGEVDLNNITGAGYYSMGSLTNKINFPQEFTDSYGVLEVVNPNYSKNNIQGNAFEIQKIWDIRGNLFIRMKGGLGASYQWQPWIKK